MVKESGIVCQVWDPLLEGRSCSLFMYNLFVTDSFSKILTSLAAFTWNSPTAKNEEIISNNLEFNLCYYYNLFLDHRCPLIFNCGMFYPCWVLSLSLAFISPTQTLNKHQNKFLKPKTYIINIGLIILRDLKM